MNLPSNPIAPPEDNVPPRAEQAHRLHWALSQRSSGVERPDGDTPLFDSGSIVIPSVLPRERADALSARITELIERGDHVVTNDKVRHLSLSITRPLQTVSRELVEIFRDPRLDRELHRVYGSEYRIQWVGLNRSFPTADPPAVSWLWHADGLPSGVSLVMLFLTDAGPDRGATEFLDVPSTLGFIDAGYRGVKVTERRSDLDVLAAERGLRYQPYRHDIHAGDAVLFNQNCLHRAVSPLHEHRDAVSFSILPSRRPWHTHLRGRGASRLDRSNRPWPRWPWAR